MITLISRRMLAAALGVLSAPFVVFSAQPDSSRPIEGLRDASPRIHALVGARIVVAPGQVIEKGTLVIRDGMIAAVGADVAAPPEARVWDVAGRTLYAGFIEPQASAFLPANWKAQPPGARVAGAAPTTGRIAATPAAADAGGPPDGSTRAWNPRVTPERSVARALTPEARAAEGLRGLGFTVANLVPSRGIYRGSTAVVSLGETLDNRALIRAGAAQTVAFEYGGDMSREYPNSLMGAVALVRQTMLDAQWYAAAQAAFASGAAKGERPEANASLAALLPVTRGEQPVFFALRDELDVERALALRQEFGWNLTLLGTGTEYRVAGALRDTGLAVVVPVAFPDAPVIETSALALDVPLHELQHWDLARTNAAALTRAGVTVAFTSHGLRRARDFWPNVRKAVAAGLPADKALAGLTTVPAKLLGTTQLGTLEAGRAAHVVVADGDLFTSEEAGIVLVWVDGEPFPQAAWERPDVRGTWRITWDGASGPEELVFSGRTPARPAGKAGETRLTTALQGEELVVLAPVKLFGGGASDKGTVRLSARKVGDQLRGAGEMPDGKVFQWSAVKTGPAPAPTAAAAARENAEGGEGGAAAKAAETAKPIARGDVFPAGAYGRNAPPVQPEVVLVRNATVWTAGTAGLLEQADILVEKGRIKQVGPKLAAPAGAVVVDATGKHVSPGLIDCHTHIAMAMGWNEGTSAVTCEVRVGDIVDATDINIYRQLASGVTAANILHGSANPIGGQNQVIKLRWGERADGLKLAGAKPGVKFALGENVTRANFPEGRGRYPLTRMGVGEIMRDTFARAAELDRRKADFAAGKSTVPVRRDLRLEAAAEMLRGERLIHIHSYRQDEILMFVRLARELKLPVATFQHVLEGYKVAPEIASLGAGASMFTDWWSFKFEVYDAIPWNGVLMRDAGVIVSFNSDDPELARRLNTEAAKAVKYGGVPPHEALQFVTRNPAKQLRLDDRIGSLEPGKDADFVIWSGSPLSTLSRVEQTWIDGRRYFSLEDDAAMREADTKERAALIQRAIAVRQRALGSGAGGGEGEGAGGEADGRPAILRQLEALTAGHNHYRDLYHSGRGGDACVHEQSGR